MHELLRTHAHTHMLQNEHWLRLERYAASKARSFRLQRLPEDLVRHIAMFLCAEDVCSLLSALYNMPCAESMWEPFPKPARFSQMPFPETFGWAWTQARGVHWLSGCLQNCAGPGLYHSRQGKKVVACLDWSPFSPYLPVIAAEYYWRNESPCHPTVLVKRWAVETIVQRRLTQGLACTTVSLYVVQPRAGLNVWHIRPVFTIVQMLCAPGVLSVLTGDTALKPLCTKNGNC